MENIKILIKNKLYEVLERFDDHAIIKEEGEDGAEKILALSADNKKLCLVDLHGEKMELIRIKE